MKIPNRLQKAELETLRNGGKDAITFFLERSQRLHEAGLVEGLSDWVKLAAPVLPDEERAEVMLLLMYGFLCMHYMDPAHVSLCKLH